MLNVSSGIENKGNKRILIEFRYRVFIYSFLEGAIITLISSETKEIITNYVEAYNSFDVPGMIKLLHKDIVFRNFSNGEVDTETHGIQDFRELAVKSTRMFSSRRQTIIDCSAIDDKIEVMMDYEGILAIDLPNGFKTGDKMQMKGKSVFRIEEGTISLIEDYS